MFTILLADDDDIIQTVISALLRSVGYTVLLASNGEEAINIAHATPPDLILMDLTMPVLSGWEATTQLKADPGLRDVPVIVFTSFGMGSELYRAFRAGCNGYLPKPIDAVLLFETVKSHLSPSPDALAAS